MADRRSVGDGQKILGLADRAYGHGYNADYGHCAVGADVFQAGQAAIVLLVSRGESAPGFSLSLNLL